jgi:hypothetical protein
MLIDMNNDANNLILNWQKPTINVGVREFPKFGVAPLLVLHEVSKFVAAGSAAVMADWLRWMGQGWERFEMPSNLQAQGQSGRMPD